MTRIGKRAGLVLAVAALGAVAALPASASATTGLYVTGGGEAGEPQLEASEYPATVTGERPSGPFEHAEVTLLSNGTQSVQCDAAVFDGGELSEPAAGGYSVAATFSDCLNAEAAEMTVDMNSCVYEYSNIELVKGKEYESDAAIACDEGDEIEIDLVAAAPLCTLKVPAQELGGAGMFNYTLGEEDIVLGLTTGTSVDYSAHGSFCVFLGYSPGAHEDGSTRIGSLLRAEF